MERAYIGIGSNLADPLLQVQTALASLRRLPQSTWISVSPLYRSRPVGPQDQPMYVNAVAVVDTGLSATALLDELQAIEAGQGRQRDGTRWGSRTLDLDILLYGQECIQTDRLSIPHPELPNRGFVLQPLYDLEPTLSVPGLGPVAGLLAAVGSNDLESVADV